jgi:glycosyltransferase involved in cell wall biosynthesis
VSGIHHFVPVLHRGDAVGRHTLRLRDAARARGMSSEIYVDLIRDETADETLPAPDYEARARPGDVVVYQLATASSMAPWLAGRPETLVVNYHNITPPELVEPWDHYLALGQARALGDLDVMVERTALAVADSAYNEAHLTEAGFTATAVVPPSAALSPEVAAAERPAVTRGRAAGARWLAVGRVAPNKAVEHAITALAVTRQHSDPAATLRIIGRPVTETYERALRRQVAELGLTEAVTFAGYASDAAVTDAYAWADVLAVTSEHEGFCVPVVEAMAAGLPVVAFDQGAVPEVLGGAGVLVTTRDPYALSRAIGELLADPTERRRVVEAGRRRLAELDLGSAAERFVDLLLPLVGGNSR